jgi:hypothetical protein
MIELDEIQLSSKIEEEADPHDLAADALSIIMKAVFDRIAEKEKIESKRKTWNKIRKVEKVKEAEKVRSKWKYPEPTVTMRSKLNLIFEEHQA